MPAIVFRKPGNFKNKRHYPQGGRKRRIGRGVRQIQKLANEVAKVKEVVNTEFKYYDTLNEDAPDPVNVPVFVATGGTPIQMQVNNIPPLTYQITGATQTRYMDSVSEREGSSVKIKSFQHNCTIENQNINGAVRVRMIVFLDLRPNPLGPSPNLGDVLQVNSTTIDPMIAPRNLSNRSRYSILLDKVYGLEPAGVISSIKTINLYKKLNFHTIWERDQITTKGLVTKNAMYCCYFADLAGCTMKCFNRIRFIDN